MKDEEIKGKIIAKLATLWAQHQEQRLGQLLENYVFPMAELKYGGRTAFTFFQEDDETLRKLEALTATVEAKHMSPEMPDANISAELGSGDRSRRNSDGSLDNSCVEKEKGGNE